MNKIKLSMLVAGLLATAQSIHAIEMTDYKVVEGNYQEVYLNGQLTVDNNGSQDQTSFNAQGDVSMKNVYTTAPFIWNIEGKAHLDSKREGNDNNSTQKEYGAEIKTNFDKYLKDDDTTFLYGRSELGYRELLGADKADDPRFLVGAGMGYGRQYDATPLAIALRIVADLKQYDIISTDVSDEAFTKLAKIIGIEEEFRSKYGGEEYSKYWYKAMEDSLKESGVIGKEGLGAFGIVRINEIFTISRPHNRYHGWTIRGGLAQVISDYNNVGETTTAEVIFDYALPMGYETQFIEHAEVSKVLDDKEAKDFSLSNDIDYTYEVSDRIDWVNRWNIDFDKYNNGGDDILYNNFSTAFQYYLANQLTLNTTLSLSKQDGNNINVNASEGDWGTTFYTGVKYRLK